ncbi:serine/threonine-protein kinase [Iamia sp.]|uniref:serine/threonine-protein kinase n=1 Tax=Iamia sp. TaxID=2722710 RepID=UPI002BF33CD9|nr:protein kinase [Iamia sp.]HXH57773.1 protein kinase [Iamia sp.]
MTELPPGASPVDRLGPGARVREWKVTRFIARGAFGQVFEATRDSWRNDEPPCALKVFDPILSSAARSALVTEFGLLRGVRHPHLIAGEDAFDIDDGPLAGCVVFVLERADTDLGSEVAQRGPLPAGEVAAIGSQLALGLAALHDGGHLHGDVKPENALRAEEVWKLGDFGVSATLQGSYARPMGATLDYRPPEVASPSAEGRVHRSADIWALGTTLWVVASGQHPFVGDDAAVRHAAVLRDDRRPAPALNRALADLIDRRCLSPDPHIRASAAELAAELRTLAEVAGATMPVASPSTIAPSPTAVSVSNAPTAVDAPTVPAAAVVGPTVPASPPPGRIAPSSFAPAEGVGFAAESRPVPDPAPHGVAPRAPMARRVLLVALLVGGAVGGLLAEVASLVAAAAPGGLGARRAAYAVLTVVLLVVVGAAARPRAEARVGRSAVLAALVGAIIIVAVVTVVLFGVA